MEVRLGINAGEVVVEGDDPFGSGGHVAAWREGLAEPGGICISGNAFEQRRDKPEIRFTDLGEPQVKNIARAVRGFLSARAMAAILVDRRSRFLAGRERT